MTYKDLILKLLKSREDLVCIEDHLMDDFRDSSQAEMSFSEWCAQNQIICKKVHQEVPAKLHLRRSAMQLAMQ